MDSTEQGTNHSTTEQPQEVKGDEANTQSQTLENGNTPEETISKAEYKKLQAEYTKSRQELSEFKKKSEMSEEDKAAYDMMKEMEFITKADLEAQAANMARESNLKEIIAGNPDLRQFEAAIRRIGADDNMAYEDIIQNYGFGAKDKLAKARSQGDVKGTPNIDQKKKSIGEMSSEEYTKWKQEKGLGKNTGSFSN